MEFTEGGGVTLSRAGQPENQARGWTEPGPLEWSGEQAGVAAFRATNVSLPPRGFPVSSECLVGSPSATLTVSPLRRHTEKRGRVFRGCLGGCLQKPAMVIPSERVEQRSGQPTGQREKAALSARDALCEPGAWFCAPVQAHRSLTFCMELSGCNGHFAGFKRECGGFIGHF